MPTVDDAAHRRVRRGRRRRRVPRYVRLSITLTVTASVVLGGTALLWTAGRGQESAAQTAQANKAGPASIGASSACGPAGPGLAAVQAFLRTDQGRAVLDGTVDRPGRQVAPLKPVPAAKPAGTPSGGTPVGSAPAGGAPAVGCAEVQRFQRWAQVPTQTGYADAVTGSVAERLATTDPAACRASAAKTVCVDLTHQTAWVSQGGGFLLGPVPVRTGKAEDATPTGTFAISQKKRHTVSSEYHVPLPFWQRFFQDFGFHAADADTPLYAANVRGSHGCVNMLPRDASALFGQTVMDTPVVIFGQKTKY